MCAQCIEELNERNFRFSTKYSRRKHHYSDTSLFAEQLKNKSQTNKLPIHRQISNTCRKLLRVVELSLIPRNSFFAHEIIHQFDVSSRLQHSILRSTTIEDSSPWLSFLAPSFRTCQRCSFFLTLLFLITRRDENFITEFNFFLLRANLVVLVPVLLMENVYIFLFISKSGGWQLRRWKNNSVLH